MQTTPTRTKTGPSPSDIYTAAQLIDEWEGVDYEGTSVRAGAKVMQAAQRLHEYVWADSVDVLRQWILGKGPVVLGTNWYESMFHPDHTSMLHVDGALAGGHAYLCIGYSVNIGAFRCINSWGAVWGKNGRFWVKEKDLARLLAEEGEACAAVEVIQ